MKTVLIVIDGFGVGAAPDAANFGDEGSNTYEHAACSAADALHNLVELGLNNIDGVNLLPVEAPRASFGRLVELSEGKDTTTGHFEIAGLVSTTAFPTYPNGFPADIIADFERAIERKTLFNGVASGTTIINEYGDEHVKTGSPIVYTSADSVFQIAMHEEVIPLEEQRHICKIARRLLTGEHAVARVIMRPFIGENGKYMRTERRQDFSVKPFAPTLLDKMKAAGYVTYAIGKIEDIFAGCGITNVDHTRNNAAGLEATYRAVGMDFDGLIFTNLVDTDMVYGHRRDREGYWDCLKATDDFLPKIISRLHEGDELIITGDHGCDPTFKGTDHTREYVPLIIYDGKTNKNLGTIEGFHFIAKHILKTFNLE